MMTLSLLILTLPALDMSDEEREALAPAHQHPDLSLAELEERRHKLWLDTAWQPLRGWLYGIAFALDEHEPGVIMPELPERPEHGALVAREELMLRSFYEFIDDVCLNVPPRYTVGHDLVRQFLWLRTRAHRSGVSSPLLGDNILDTARVFAQRDDITPFYEIRRFLGLSPAFPVPGYGCWQERGTGSSARGLAAAALMQRREVASILAPDAFPVRTPTLIS